ncbi:hypothetical protein, partial [Paenibacillus thiaminolyticus]|uniref:hypothetical protein n=1 Tax=Paenibacillus thiaminolyticus TaxID=49283 RepID=UPI002282FBDE
LAFGGIVASWGLNVWRELRLFYRNFGSMSPHFEELLHSYIILGPFELSRRETGEIAAVSQDSLSGEVVPTELLYWCRILPTESTCLEKPCSFEDFAYRIDISLCSFQALRSDKIFLLRDKS